MTPQARAVYERVVNYLRESNTLVREHDDMAKRLSERSLNSAARWMVEYHHCYQNQE